MKSRIQFARVFIVSLFVVTVLAANLVAQDQETPRRRARGLYGDWTVKTKFGEREMESILAFGRGADRQRTGQWISLWGVTDLKEISFENGELRFTQERRGRDGQNVVSRFVGKIVDGKLNGTLKSGDNERSLEGARRPRVSRAAGTWNVRFKVGEREIENQFVVSSGSDGKLAVDWKSERVEHQISDVAYERGNLTFKSHAKLGEREWDSTVECSIEGHELKGTMTSGERTMELKGARSGAAVIGTWNLVLAPREGSDRPARKQRLRVFPDMSGLYGSSSVEKVAFEDGALSFKIVTKFGDRSFETIFSGKISESKLNGALETSRGTRRVEGTKAPRWSPRRSRGEGSAGGRRNSGETI